MLPYLAQGANSAIEDGTVLGLLLGHIKSKADVAHALAVYQKLRKTRGDAIVAETFKQVRCCIDEKLLTIFIDITVLT